MAEGSVLNPTLMVMEMEAGESSQDADYDDAKLAKKMATEALSQEEVSYIVTKMRQELPPSKALEKAFVDSDVALGCLPVTSIFGLVYYTFYSLFTLIFPVMTVLFTFYKKGYWDACTGFKGTGVGNTLSLEECVAAAGGNTFIWYMNNSMKYSDWAVMMFFVAYILFAGVVIANFHLVMQSSLARILATRGIVVQTKAKCFGYKMLCYSWNVVVPLFSALGICIFVGYLVSYLSEDDDASLVSHFDDILGLSPCNTSSVFTTVNKNNTWPETQEVFTELNLSSIAFCFDSDNPTAPRAPPTGVNSLLPYATTFLSFIPWFLFVFPYVFSMYGTLSNDTLSNPEWHKAMGGMWKMTRMSAIRASDAVVAKQRHLKALNGCNCIQTKCLCFPSCYMFHLIDKSEEAISIRLFFLNYAKKAHVWTLQTCGRATHQISGPFLQDAKDE